MGNMGKLNVGKIRALNLPGMYGDGGTLYLCVARGGSKSWIQRLTVNRRRVDLGLGGWPVVGLAKARERAFLNRIAVSEGRDPLAEKRRAKVPTFAEAAESTFRANRGRWRNAKHVSVWTQSLDRYAMPVIGGMPLDQIGQADVLRVLTPIWTDKAATARKVRQRIRTILSWAQAHGFVEHNAAGEGINGALPPMPKQRAHYRALPFAEVAAALETVEGGRASLAAKACLQFVVLTASRSGEARGTTWEEIDADNRVWLIPGERMKSGAAHRVPLSDAALAVLDRVRTLDDGSGLVFPSPARRGKPLSDMALTKLLRDAGLAGKATVHGFRTSFRTWASERTNAAHAVMELCLAHAVGNEVERAYARSDLFDKRRALMNGWAQYVTGGEANIVSLRA